MGRRVLFLAGLMLAGTVGAARGESGLAPEGLRCEYRTDPVGIDAAGPRLSWTLRCERRGQVQTAYQILVAGARQNLDADDGDLWDSGKVSSAESILIPYAGKTLRAHQPCYWKVRVWDSGGAFSAWSKPASWTMGMPPGATWNAKWIGWRPAPSTSTAETRPAKPAAARSQPLPILRREFDVAKPVDRACIYICGLGFHELRLNGQKVGDHELEPAWTNYRKTCSYTAYDVTKRLAQGRNALGVMLGNGMYNVVGGRYTKFTGSFGPPKLILLLHIDFADGTSADIGTDDSWRIAASPITFSCIYGGEDYDARLDPGSWDRPGFDDHAWQTAAVAEGPGGSLLSQVSPPIKVMKVFQPVQVAEPRSGVYVYDLGQNFSGWPQIRVKGPAGSQVKMIPAELLDAKGFATQRGSGGPCSFTYTLKGGGPETWHPRFTYYGFRYVQVEGAVRESDQARGNMPVVLDLTGQFVHSAAPTVGEFSCSNPLFNRIHEIILAAVRSNMQSVVTDCPHREKLGWLEVPHLLGPAITFNFDVSLLYTKISDDMAEAQLDNGLVPDIAPEYTVFKGGFRDSPEWGSAAVIVPWLVFQRYGDRTILENHYDLMKRYVEYLGSTAKDHIVSHGLGDWCDFGPAPYGPSQHTPIPLTATAFYYADTSILAETARLLGKSGDAEKFTQLAQGIREAFNRTFFHADASSYATGSQVSNAMPLVLGLVRPETAAGVLGNVVKDVRAHSNHLTAGDVGNRFLVQALNQGGRSDVLCDMTNQRDVPSYGSQIEQGATALTEVWDPKRGFSQNHCMLGHIEEWFYNGLAGIHPDPQAPGFEKIIIKPQVVGDLTWVRGRYDSVRGRIVSEWKRENGALTLDVTIPANTTATMFVPAREGQAVTEGEVPAERAAGVTLVRREADVVVYRIGSGTYHFRVPQ